MESTLTTDKPTDVLAVLREVKITVNDVGYHGELERLAEFPAAKARGYFSPAGATLDEFGEIIWSRGLMTVRPTCNDILELLERLLQPAGARARSEAKRDLAVIEADEHALEVRRKTRLRLYVCVGCGTKLRVADDYLDASHNHIDPDDGCLRVYPFKLETPILRPSTPF